MELLQGGLGVLKSTRPLGIESVLDSIEDVTGERGLSLGLDDLFGGLGNDVDFASVFDTEVLK